ncbi:hypothetical protein TELCIR_22387, partial [Teladorsagia circumcincta]
IDEACEADEQCQGGSTCDGAVCACPAGEEEVDGVCVKKMKSRKITTCPIAGQTPYIDRKTTNVQFCEPSAKNSCPRGYSCQFSETAQQNICCGGGGGTDTRTRFSKITEPGAPGPDPETESETDAPPEATTFAPEVCEKGSAYLINGKPKLCTNSPCPSGYKCTFSRISKNYFCCSSFTGNHVTSARHPVRPDTDAFAAQPPNDSNAVQQLRTSSEGLILGIASSTVTTKRTLPQ